MPARAPDASVHARTSPQSALIMGGRFSAPVFPGETVRVDIWRAGPGRAAFQARVAARDVVVMDNGTFDYEA
ncbi:hydratase [Bordetella pertussis]|nr:hydratase [Bordetella pertussis]